MLQYAVIVPVYRGENTITELSGRIISFFTKIKLSFELIFVYDAGPDNSWEIIQGLQEQYPQNIKAIKLSRNFGQHNAIICGLKHAKANFIITMDEDLQHQPEDISLLIEEQARGNYDIVYGKYNELNHSSFRNITSAILKQMLKVSIPDLHPDYTAFRLIKSNIAKSIISMNNSYTFLDGYLSWVTTNCSSVTVTHEERKAGKSSYTIPKLVNHTINIFVTFSVLPIRFVTFSSIFIFILSIFYSLFLLGRKIFYQDLISGYASMMISIGMGVGLILFSLGIIGEYLHRVNLKTTKKPNFIESEKLERQSKDNE